MHVIIVGCGRVGSQLALMLSREGHDVVIIDRKASSFKRLGSSFNGITLTGVGFDPDVLKRAGVDRADAVAAVTNGDNSNIMIGQVAKRIFKVPKVIARLYDPERAHIYKKFGLDTICSTIIGANLIKNLVLEETFAFRMPIGSDATLIEFKAKSKHIGKKVTDLNIEGIFMPSALERAGETIIPKKGTLIQAEDKIIGISKTSSLDTIKQKLGLTAKEKPKIQ